MSLLKTISDFLDSIFKRSSPEVQKKQMMKKLDSEIKEFTPGICKTGLLQPNFGEAINALNKNTRVLDNLFAVTISPNNIPRQHRFESQLLFTGFSIEEQGIIEDLDFEKRKAEVLEDYDHADKVYLHQRNQLDKIVKSLNSDIFKKMDSDILNLRQFAEFCRYNFTPFLQIFDSNYEPVNFSYKPNYVEVPVSKAMNLLEDLYYQINGIKINEVTLNAIYALAKMRKGTDLTDDEKNIYAGCLKKINYVVKSVIPPYKLKLLIRYGKQDIAYEPRVASVTGSPRQDFLALLKQQFDADEKRIKNEIQDEKITTEVNALFPNGGIEELYGYNQSTNAMLQNEVNMSFTSILPLKILKTFLAVYLPDSVKSLLNDIVIEGFFNNPTYKSSFSQVVFAVINAKDAIQAFEDSFATNQKNSIQILESYIKDSKRDKDFYKKLEKMVENINTEAHALLQEQVSNIFSLYKELGELIEDAKKPSGEIITNLKVLMMSSRNRDNTNMLETHYGEWNIFFEIMKNYVIINSGEM